MDFNINDIKPVRAFAYLFLVIYFCTGFLLVYIFNHDEYLKLDFLKLTFISISIIGVFLLSIAYPILQLIPNPTPDDKKNPDILIGHYIVYTIMFLSGIFLFITFIILLKLFFDVSLQTALIITFIFSACLWLWAINLFWKDVKSRVKKDSEKITKTPVI